MFNLYTSFNPEPQVQSFEANKKRRIDLLSLKSTHGQEPEKENMADKRGSSAPLNRAPFQEPRPSATNLNALKFPKPKN